MKHSNPFKTLHSQCLLFGALFMSSTAVQADALPTAPQLNYSKGTCQASDLKITRTEYHEKLQGFWIGQCIANWTGLKTEGVRKSAPYYTDADWGKPHGYSEQVIDFELRGPGRVWGADDDTDVEYIHQELLLKHQTSMLEPEHIRNGWLKHMIKEEPNYLWVSNERALKLMMKGMLPPETSLPKNNKHFDQIDAQLTTEIFGLFAPGRPDVALKMAHLPIRTVAYRDAEWISEFYVIMYSLAPTVDPELSTQEQVMWLADQARQRLPSKSFPAKMYDWIKQDYEANPNKNDWEKTRDELSRRHTGLSKDGYNYRSWFDAGINYGSSLISLFYGQGDFKRTLQIGTLCGWDSDNPTATWGGMLGFMLGLDSVQQQFPDVELTTDYKISRTRINFPNRTPGERHDDTFELMANRGIQVIDRVVIDEMGGAVDLDKDTWCIPATDKTILPAKF